MSINITFTHLFTLPLKYKPILDLRKEAEKIFPLFCDESPDLPFVDNKFFESENVFKENEVEAPDKETKEVKIEKISGNQVFCPKDLISLPDRSSLFSLREVIMFCVQYPGHLNENDFGTIFLVRRFFSSESEIENDPFIEPADKILVAWATGGDINRRMLLFFHFDKFSLKLKNSEGEESEQSIYYISKTNVN